MGKGSSATESSVRKTLGVSMGGNGNGRNRDKKSETNECELTIATRLVVPASTTVRKGDSVTLTLASDGKLLDLFIESSYLGHYTGPNGKLISECIVKGYVYRGKVMETQNQSTGILTTISVTGLMK